MWDACLAEGGPSFAVGKLFWLRLFCSKSGASKPGVAARFCNPNPWEVEATGPGFKVILGHTEFEHSLHYIILYLKTLHGIQLI